MPLSDRFWIATADTLLFENVRYAAHCSEVQQLYYPVLQLNACSRYGGIGPILRANWLYESHPVRGQLLEVDVHEGEPQSC